MRIIKTLGLMLAVNREPDRLGAHIGAGKPARRRITGRRPLGGLDGFAEQILAIADSLAELLDEAALRSLISPPPISNSIHDLRGWAGRINQSAVTRPAAVDATRLLAYLRELSDHELLALVAELPWARLDILLDAVGATPSPHPRSPRS